VCSLLCSLLLACPSIISFRLGFPRIPVVETGHWLPIHSETRWTHVPLEGSSMAFYPWAPSQGWMSRTQKETFINPRISSHGLLSLNKKQQKRSKSPALERFLFMNNIVVIPNLYTFLLHIFIFKSCHLLVEQGARYLQRKTAGLDFIWERIFDSDPNFFIGVSISPELAYSGRMGGWD
jgi:hypothetical protein